jgi:hypothetical protein
MRAIFLRHVVLLDVLILIFGPQTADEGLQTWKGDGNVLISCSRQLTWPVLEPGGRAGSETSHLKTQACY